MPAVTWEQRAEDLAYADREFERIMAASSAVLRAAVSELRRNILKEPKL